MFQQLADATWTIHLTLRLARGNNGLRLCEQAPRAANLKSSNGCVTAIACDSFKEGLSAAHGEGFLAGLLAPPFSLQRRWLPLRKEVVAGLAAGAQWRQHLAFSRSQADSLWLRSEQKKELPKDQSWWQLGEGTQAHHDLRPSESNTPVPCMQLRASTMPA